MSAEKVTRRYVGSFKHCFIVDEDFRHYLFSRYGMDSQGYNSGVYGWNFSFIPLRYDIAICWGYRNMPGKYMDFEVQKKYVELAKAISNLKDYDEQKRKAEELRDKLVEEIRSGAIG